MAPEKPVTSNENVNEDRNGPSANAPDQILLKALKDMIVHVVNLKRTNDVNQIPLSPEAGNLITALQEFIMSIIGQSSSMTMGRNTIVEVSLVQDGNVSQSKHEEVGHASKDALLLITPPEESHGDTKVAIKESQHTDSAENLPQKFQEKLLKGLREHVFNTMPIRMLSFQPHGSALRITLLERGAVHQRLESALREKIHQEDFIPIMRHSDTGWMELETDEQIIERLITKYARYAILSHTWLRTSDEITYGNWNKGQFDTEAPGYQKLVNFCKVAWNDYGLTLGWMDTICINKESSSELDESIRSMYHWYNRAEVCITHLADTANISDMHTDRWFTRGWTLQELLAPRIIKFYNSTWTKLIEHSKNDKNDTNSTEQIERATTISKKELDLIYHVSISRKMQLAATREVTREEDAAYSLMGIFNVNISTAYGEGAQRAFFRLLREILASAVNVMDIFNWAGDLPSGRPHPSQLLPISPLYYLHSNRLPYLHSLPTANFVDTLTILPLEPLIPTHLGLRVPVILMPALFVPNEAPQFVAIGDYRSTVNISPIPNFSRALYTPPTATYNVLDNRASGQDGPFRANNGCQVTLAVLNVSGDADAITIYRTCLAKVLDCSEGVDKVISSGRCFVIDTDMPVVFELVCTASSYDPPVTIFHSVKRRNLAKHGMKLVSLYL